MRADAKRRSSNTYLATTPVLCHAQCAMSLLDDGDDDLFLSVNLSFVLPAGSVSAGVGGTPAARGVVVVSDGDGDVNGAIDVDSLPPEVVDVDGGPHATHSSAGSADCRAAGAAEVRAESVGGDAAAGDALSRTLHQYFGYTSFRPGQRGVIEAVLSGRDTCVFWATGAGKSLCFILPALLDRRRVVVVVSPLISLMVDQAAKINATIGGSASTPLATYLGSAQADAGEEAAALSGERPVVFLSPEKVMDGSTVPRLDALRRSGRLALIAIDEAHCILQWGEAFRKDYGCLTGLRGSLPGVPLMALTATAAPDHRADICSLLHLHDPYVASASFDRTNLALRVQTLDAGAAGKAAVVDRLAAELLVRPESTIVYVMTRKYCESVHDTLTKRVRRARPAAGAARSGGPSAAPVRVRRYHAGLSLAERAETHRQFAQGIATVVVATVAFGMGIDRPDVRSIVMLGPPKTVAEYMQQAGRAGRDGRPSRCLMVASQHDFSSYLSPFYMRGLSEQSQVAMAASIEALRNYAHDTTVCRRAALMQLYGETPSFDRCPPGTGACDVCDPPPVGSVPARRVRGQAVGGASPIVMNRAALAILLRAADGPAPHGYSRPSIIYRTQDSWRINRKNLSPAAIAAEQACMVAMQRARAAVPAGTPLDIYYFRSIFNVVVQAGLLQSGASDTKYGGPRRPPIRYPTFPLTPAGREFLARPNTASLPAPPPPSASGGPMRELVEAGIDAMAVLPSSEVAVGSGPIMAAYLNWARLLTAAPAVGPATRSRLQALLSAVHGWRDAAAEAAGVSPEELLPPHLAVAVATARPASVEGLRACGVRAAGLDGLVAVLDDWRAGKGDSGDSRGGELDGGAMDDPILSDDEAPAHAAGRWPPHPLATGGGPPPRIEMASAIAARSGATAADGPAGAVTSHAIASPPPPAGTPLRAPLGRRPRVPRAPRMPRLPRQPREGPATSGRGSRAGPLPLPGPAAAVLSWVAAAEPGGPRADANEDVQGPKRRRV